MSEKRTGAIKKDIRFLVMDVDGTLTDGKIYMGQDGEVCKAFDIKDGCGIAVLLPKMNVEPIIITARESRIVQNRCAELGIKLLFQGKHDKLPALNRILSEYNASHGTSYGLEHCAYIGDDIIDVPCMQAIHNAGGIAALREICDFVSTKNGGNGAVRECIELLLQGR